MLVARLLNFRTDEGKFDLGEAVSWLTGGDERPADPPPLAVSLDVALAAARFRLPAGVVVRPAAEWSAFPLHYLVAERKVPEDQIDRWGLGYALGGKLAGRVVFPVRDAAGDVRSYSARTFVGDRLKWRSADRHDHPDHDALFGEAFWPRRGRESVVVVEAALDALAAEAATDRRRSVAAIHGSEPVDAHVEKLGTFSEVLVATDPDEAGEKIYQFLRGTLARWTTVRRVRMPDGADASALWRTDPHALRRLLAD